MYIYSLLSLLWFKKISLNDESKHIHTHQNFAQQKHRRAAKFNILLLFLHFLNDKIALSESKQKEVKVFMEED